MNNLKLEMCYAAGMLRPGYIAIMYPNHRYTAELESLRLPITRAERLPSGNIVVYAKCVFKKRDFEAKLNISLIEDIVEADNDKL